MSIDHTGLTVDGCQRSKAFCLDTLRPPGVELIAEVEGWAGFGAFVIDPDGHDVEAVCQKLDNDRRGGGGGGCGTIRSNSARSKKAGNNRFHELE